MTQRGNYRQIRCIALRVSKLRMGFSVPSIIWVGAKLMQITMQRTRPAWLAKTKLRMTLDCSKQRKSWQWVDFLSRAGGRHCFILARDKNKKDQKNLRGKLVDYCSKQGDHKQRTLVIVSDALLLHNLRMCIRFRALSIKSSMLIPVGRTILKWHSNKLQI